MPTTLPFSLPLGRFFRRRFFGPLLIAAALLLALLGELTYALTRDTLGNGIALADARLGTAAALQRITDAEAAQRGYLLTGRAEYLAQLRQARAAFERDDSVFKFISGIGPNGQADAQGLRQAALARFAELERIASLAPAGPRPPALPAADNSLREQTALRALFDRKLAEASRLQHGARTVQYTALWFNRSAVVLLSLLMALSLYLHMRQLKQQEQERDKRQQTLETQVAVRTRELRTLAGHLQTVREDEKSRLARELHDELGGLLTAAKLILARMRVKLAADPEMLERIEHINQRLSEGIALKRRIIEDLRPSTLSALGLNTALMILCADTHHQVGIPVQTDIDDPALSPVLELAIFRTVQEALTNIGKYASASEVTVRLKAQPAEVRLEVTDNGVGFDAQNIAPGRHGLAGMRFRAESLGGKMQVHAQPGRGTQIVVRLPVQPTEHSLPASV